MGTILPPNWPVIKDEKFYKVIADGYRDFPGPFDCSATYRGRRTCCRAGVDLNFWIDAGAECTSPNEICPTGTGEAQRLLSIIGPYDTIDECWADV